MNSTFTVNEDIVRRLVLRHDAEEREPRRSRHGLVSTRFWRELIDLAHQPNQSSGFVSRAR
jgi:hypothetical protein